MAEQLKIKSDSFGIWARAIFWMGIVIFAIHASTHMVAAGDTWVALACGRHFDNHGVDTVEPFSANSHNPGPTESELAEYPDWSHGIIKKIHPTGWINQNWLTHLLFYKVAKVFGDAGELNYDTLVYWKFGVNLLTAFLIYYFARLLGVSIPGSAVASAFAMFTARTFLDIRPAVHANLLVAAYLVILGLTTYRNVRFIWLIVPLAILWANLHGGYIYIYMMLVPFFGIHLIGNFILKDRLVVIDFKKLWHVVAAGAASFVAMTIFNPFHLTNLTHTFIISVSEHAESWRTVNEWHSAWEWKNPVGQETAFLVLFIIMWLAAIAWTVARFLRPAIKSKRRATVTHVEGDYEWPKIDLAMIAVAGATVMMAVKMRRFIPIGAFAAAPVIAMFIEQAVAMITARRRYDDGKGLSLPQLPKEFRQAILLCGLAAVIGFGTIWGLKFKKVYLEPWPSNDERTSIFMRMTASWLKPIDLCKFINANEISGNMFNFWTEGGALAFGQDPDPETGRTPLQLFMDGRAQAAYDHSTFQLWRYLYGGGCPLAYKVRQMGRVADQKETMQIAEVLDAEMKKRDIWVLALPANEFSPDSNPRLINYLPIALPRHPDWKMTYSDPYQIMYVDISTDPGRKLFTNVLRDEAEFPTELSRHITLARLKTVQRNTTVNREALDHAKLAFEIDPSPVTASILINVANAHRNLRSQVVSVMQDYLDNFRENRQDHMKRDGYSERLTAAAMSADLISKIYARQRSEDASRYRDLLANLNEERDQMKDNMGW